MISKYRVCGHSFKLKASESLDYWRNLGLSKNNQGPWVKAKLYECYYKECTLCGYRIQVRSTLIALNKDGDELTINGGTPIL